MRTSLFSCQLSSPSNVLSMNAPNPLTWTVTAEEGVLSPLVVSQGDNAALQTDQSMFVVAVRLWSNFADGLLFSYPAGFPVSSNTPQFALYEGPLTVGQIVPPKYIDCIFNTLNEWIPVEKPLPRNALSVGPHGYPIANLFAGGGYFLTNSIATGYNTTPVLFAFQALISCSYK